MPVETSVVIPCYNAAAYVGAAIESCLAEGIPAEQIIVVDDGSTDTTLAVLQGVKAPICIHQQENGGPSRARNAGLKRVETPFMVFLDADDLYEGGMLKALETQMRDAQADLGFGATQVVRSGGQLGPRKTPPPVADSQDFLEAWLGGQTVQTNSYMWRVSFLRQIGGWRENMKTLEEIEVVVRAVLQGARLTTTDIGHSRYIDQGNTDRVSYGNTAAIIRSAIDGFSELEPMLSTAGQRFVLGQRYYHQARAAFRQGHTALGREALTHARECGFKGHIGTKGHRILAGILGLERKETSWLRRDK